MPIIPSFSAFSKKKSTFVLYSIFNLRLKIYPVAKKKATASASVIIVEGIITHPNASTVSPNQGLPVRTMI